MPSNWTPEGRARINAGVAEANRRRGYKNRAERKKYTQHKANAKQRGIAFLLTFDEWWAVWQESGKWALRGPNVGQYCMSRFGDSGPYAVGNVFINLSVKNVSDGPGGRPKPTGQRARMSETAKARKRRLDGTFGQP